MAENRTNLQKSEATIDELVLKANEALKADSIKVFDDAMESLDKEIANYNAMAEKAAYDACLAAEKPIVELATVFFFTGRRSVEERSKDTKKLMAIKVEPTSRRLSLSKFIKNYGLDRGVLTDINHLYERFVIREKKVLTLSAIELRDEYKKGSSFFKECVDSLKSGGTPDSNTQIAKSLQNIINSCGVEKRVTNHDIHMLQQWLFNHDAKNKGTSKVVTSGKFESYIVDVLNHHITGAAYTVLEKQRG